MNDLSLTRIAMELLQINEEFQYYCKYIDTKISDFRLYTFDQIWGSTALGFGGFGGSAMTSARTYVLIPEVADELCMVFFAGKYAYSVPYSDVFTDDVKNECVRGKWEIQKYQTA